MFCTIGDARDADSELTFFPPPVEATPSVPGSKCTARYAPERLITSKSQDNTFVIEVGLGQYLFYSDEADRDRALALLQGHSQFCWVGGAGEDVFSDFFEWGSAVTYF